MVKQEIRIELTNTDDLRSFIEKAYYTDGDHGKIIDSNKNYITINDDLNLSILSGLDKNTVKVSNSEIIDGSMRFIIDESNGDVRLYPISIYSIKEQDKYSFY